jgi:hypothetical protein
VAWRPVRLLCGGTYVSVAPGKQLRQEFRLFAGQPGSLYRPALEVQEISGEYRLVWDVLNTPSTNVLLPLELRVSNAFRLALPDTHAAP